MRAVTFTSDCWLDQVYLNGECRFPRCDDDQFSGYTLSPCGSGATCTDESVSGIPEFTSPICQCVEPSYASSLAADPTLAPYREGCVSPPRSESVNSLKSDLQESIHKSVFGSPYKLSQLGFRMVGTDLRPETMPFWNSTVVMNEHNSRSWVALVPSSGVLSVAEFQDFRVSVVLNSSLLPEQTSPYEAVLYLFVASPVARQYDKARAPASIPSFSRTVRRAQLCYLIATQSRLAWLADFQRCRQALRLRVSRAFDFDLGPCGQ